MSSICKKNPIFSEVLPHWTPTRPPQLTRCGAYSTSRPPLTFCNIQKLNLCSKTDIAKTACLNAWVRITQKVNAVVTRNIGHIIFISVEFQIYISVLLKAKFGEDCLYKNLSKKNFQHSQKSLLWSLFYVIV